MKKSLAVFGAFILAACGRGERETAKPSWAAWGPGFVCDGFQKSWNMESTHAWLVRSGFRILEHDGEAQNLGKGYAMLKADAENIAKFANAPDVDDVDLCTFSSHFYNPDTSTNYLGLTPTAKERFLENARVALSSYVGRTLSGKETLKRRTYVVPGVADWLDILVALAPWTDKKLFEEKTEDVPLAAYSLGKAIHFATDTCNPHHAKNVTAFDTSVALKHSDYEAWIDENEERWATDTLAGPWPDPRGFGEMESDLLHIMKPCSRLAFESFGEVMNPGTRDAATRRIMAANQGLSALILNRFAVALDPGVVTKWELLDKRRGALEALTADAARREAHLFEALRGDGETQDARPLAGETARLQERALGLQGAQRSYLVSLGEAI